jgi:hypothetical protein
VTAVMSGMGTTSVQWMKRSTAMRQYVQLADIGRGLTRSYVEVQKTGCRRGKVAQCSYCMAGDFGALAGLASTCPGAAIFLHAWPQKNCATSFSDSLVPECDRSCTEWNTWSRRGLERTVEVPQQRVAIDGDHGAGDR